MKILLSYPLVIFVPLILNLLFTISIASIFISHLSIFHFLFCSIFFTTKPDVYIFEGLKIATSLREKDTANFHT